MQNRITGYFLNEGALNESLCFQFLEEAVTSTIIAYLKNDGLMILFMSKMEPIQFYFSSRDLLDGHTVIQLITLTFL